jgi:Mrp family chromosome partitioning ATPase
MAVSRFADGILLVTRAGTTTHDQTQAARTACSKAGAKIFGAVLNAATVTEGDQPAYYAYYGNNGQRTSDANPEADFISVLSNGNRNGLPPSVPAGRASRHRRGRPGAS